MDWKSVWTAMQGELQRLEDARQAFEAAFDPAADRPRLERAKATVEFARDLCRFLTTARNRGVFDALLQNEADQAEAREQLLTRLGECLRLEAILLERAGMKPEQVRAVMEDVRAAARPPYPTVPRDLWNKHVQQAIDAACLFPKSEVLLLARNAHDYSQELLKKYKWVSAVVVGTVNGLSAAVDPTMVGAAKVSMFIAKLVALGHTGHGDAPPDISA